MTGGIQGCVSCSWTRADPRPVRNQPCPRLAYAELSRHFPLAYAGRANTALNLLVFLGAFGAQYAIGLVIGLWPVVDGRSPAAAYTAAFAMVLVVQLAALAWFYWAGISRAAAGPASAASDAPSSLPSENVTLPL